jgi:hypothetical protein
LPQPKRFKKFPQKAGISNYQKVKEGKPAVADQRNLDAKTSIADIAAEVEKKVLRNLLRPMTY